MRPASSPVAAREDQPHAGREVDPQVVHKAVACHVRDDRAGGRDRAGLVRRVDPDILVGVGAGVAAGLVDVGVADPRLRVGVDDRDADAFFTASGNNGNQQDETEPQPDSNESQTSAGPASGPAVIDLPLDDHRGNMINFDV